MTIRTADDLEDDLVEAFATDLSTGEKQKLTTKKNSRCHFFERFRCAGYDVQLRLDWGVQDSHKNPMLDADFYNLKTNKQIKSKRKHPAHNTSAQSDGTRIYVWKFEGELKDISVTLLWKVSVEACVQAVVTCEVKVIRANAPR